jgi:glycine cleavage system H lipoate-binding protein
MTNKIYKTAMGKTVDLGALILQNEQVRAVGNMGVNAAGAIIDSNNQIIDQRNSQVQRQYKKQIDSSSKKTS